MKYFLACMLVSIGKFFQLPMEKAIMPEKSIKKCGIGYLVTDKDAKDFRKTLKNSKCSLRKAKHQAVENTKLVVIEGIMTSLINKGYLKISTKKTFKGTIVTGEVLVYGK